MNEKTTNKNRKNEKDNLNVNLLRKKKKYIETTIKRDRFLTLILSVSRLITAIVEDGAPRDTVAGDEPVGPKRDLITLCFRAAVVNVLNVRTVFDKSTFEIKLI